MHNAYKQIVTEMSPTAFLRSAIDIPVSASSKSARRQVVNVFLRLCGDKFSDFGDISYDFLAGWIIKMAYEGYTLKTIAYYLKVLSAIYTDAVAAGLAEPTDTFANVGLRLNSLSGVESVERFDYNALQQFVRSLVDRVQSNSLSENIVLYALLGGGLTAKGVVELRRNDFRADIPALEEIKKHYARPRASYLFPLRRGDLTIVAVVREVDLRMQSVLSASGLKISADALWAAAALHQGIDARAILAILGHVPAEMPFFGLIEPADLAEEERRDIIGQVADAMIDNPVRWMAMQLRPGAKFEDMMSLSQLKADSVYYPFRKVARRNGSRLSFDDKPVIPGLVFFRANITDVPELFQRIGSLAWVYRLSDSPSAPYAVIPSAQMKEFQLAVGVFSSESDKSANKDFKPGDTVEFIGGDFRGLTAKIQSVAPTVYRLLLPALNGIEWHIDADPRLLYENV